VWWCCWPGVRAACLGGWAQAAAILLMGACLVCLSRWSGGPGGCGFGVSQGVGLLVLAWGGRGLAADGRRCEVHCRWLSCGLAGRRWGWFAWWLGRSGCGGWWGRDVGQCGWWGVKSVVVSGAVRVDGGWFGGGVLSVCCVFGVVGVGCDLVDWGTSFGAGGSRSYVLAVLVTGVGRWSRGRRVGWWSRARF